MKTRIGQTVGVIAIAAVAVILFAGSAFAHTNYPLNGRQASPESDSGYGYMMDEIDPELWAKMIQHMNEVHGPELTGEMIQWMTEEDFQCPGFGGPMGGMMGYGNRSELGSGTRGYNNWHGQMMGRFASQ